MSPPIFYAPRVSQAARDKALSLLYVEAPVLPPAALSELEWLCGLCVRDGHAPADTEQRTLGLITLRDVIANRSAERGASLALVLRCTVHEDETLRSKAIRMVVNQLHPLDVAKHAIETFAADGLRQALPPEEDAEATRCHISLYFALCTRAHALLPQLFEVFAACSPGAKAAFHHHMAGLARAIGPAAEELLHVIKSPPPGAEALTLQALQALCDGAEPSSAAQLLPVARAAYAQAGDVRFLLPCVQLLPREEVRDLVPQMVALPSDALALALRRLLSCPSPPMSPAEIMVALHAIDPARDGVTLKKVIEACGVCFSASFRDLFPPEQLAVALQQLVEQAPLPLLFMRTVIQTVAAAPTLHGFILDLLSKLVLRQVWKSDPKLWDGVLRCAKQMVPRSFIVYLQLPADQLREALASSPDLAAPLAAYAANPTIRASIPDEIDVILEEGNVTT